MQLDNEVKGRGRAVWRAVLAVGGLLVVAACSPYPDSQYMSWSLPEAEKQTQVDWVELEHKVEFAPGQAIPRKRDLAALSQFLERSRPGYGTRLFVSADAGGLAQERRAAIEQRLKAAGYKVESLVEQSGSGDVTVIVGRYVATPPACPDWRKPADGDRGNTPMSNLGCATESNLAAMVADPGDLIRGRRPGAADGETAAAGIQRYREGKVTPLKIESTSESK